MSERFQVRSITGYSITPSYTSRKQSTTWWVSDTADRCREMMLLSPSQSHYGPDRARIDVGDPTGVRLTHFESVARFTADRLNAEHG